ncbi:CDGSH iron-sulfur domain-containing protein [Amycolatopsis pittospori]|uniref:CDGSH iron-sulfur domain-containing protein n=1 Tax=Amycolatopsis pittospori TaxID=2749434 RepID=UPI0015F07B85|nr:CDGSH iron-sulfur domain-containing protein [Amycolatopsis pittospori]
MNQPGPERPAERPDRPSPSAEVTITPCENGPLLVRGPVELRSQAGEVIEARRDPVALCRCGRSAIKPFCDGTHKVANFRAASGPSRDPLRPDVDAADESPRR